MREIIFDELKVGKEVVTRDGRKGRVICTDYNSPEKRDYPIICLIDDGLAEKIEIYTKSGEYELDYFDDIDIFLPPKTEYVNIYYNSIGNSYYCGESYDDKKHAKVEVDSKLRVKYIKTIEVEL